MTKNNIDLTNTAGKAAFLELLKIARLHKRLFVYPAVLIGYHIVSIIAFVALVSPHTGEKENPNIGLAWLIALGWIVVSLAVHHVAILSFLNYIKSYFGNTKKSLLLSTFRALLRIDVLLFMVAFYLSIAVSALLLKKNKGGNKGGKIGLFLIVGNMLTVGLFFAMPLAVHQSSKSLPAIIKSSITNIQQRWLEIASLTLSLRMQTFANFAVLLIPTYLLSVPLIYGMFKLVQAYDSSLTEALDISPLLTFAPIAINLVVALVLHSLTSSYVRFRHIYYDGKSATPLKKLGI